LASVRRAASLYGAVVLLKGPDTLITAPREGVLVAAYGRPSLATAGSGDVLTGVVAAFLAKGLEPRRAAGAAAVGHGIASGLVRPQRGLVAGDLLAGIQRALDGEGAAAAPQGLAAVRGAGGA
jgi:NAD(P)H-hydrate epimerase